MMTYHYLHAVITLSHTAGGDSTKDTARLPGLTDLWPPQYCGEGPYGIQVSHWELELGLDYHTLFGFSDTLTYQSQLK